jgi:hypothetical protein
VAIVREYQEELKDSHTVQETSANDYAEDKRS